MNLVDLVDSPRTGLPIDIFPTLAELQDYTIRTGKFFPREDVYAGSLLQHLLRDILRPQLVSTSVDHDKEALQCLRGLHTLRSMNAGTI